MDNTSDYFRQRLFLFWQNWYEKVCYKVTDNSGTPVAGAAKALYELQDNLSRFYDGWEEWQDLQKMH